MVLPHPHRPVSDPSSINYFPLGDRVGVICRKVSVPSPSTSTASANHSTLMSLQIQKAETNPPPFLTRGFPSSSPLPPLPTHLRRTRRRPSRRRKLCVTFPHLCSGDTSPNIINNTLKTDYVHNVTQPSPSTTDPKSRFGHHAHLTHQKSK